MPDAPEKTTDEGPEIGYGYLCARCYALVDDFNLAEAEAEGFNLDEDDILCRKCR